MLDMSTETTPAERRRLAEIANVHEQYLYQCLTGRRDMNPAEARRCEEVTGGALRRWALCQKTWHLIWPELVGVKGAPRVPSGAVVLKVAPVPAKKPSRAPSQAPAASADYFARVQNETAARLERAMHRERGGRRSTDKPNNRKG